MAHEQHPRTVLIVDDEPTLLDLLALVLRGEAYDATTAPDGSAAFDLLGAQTFDFIMPGMDRVRLFEALRARGDSTYFVMMTSLPLRRVQASARSVMFTCKSRSRWTRSWLS